MGLTVLMSLNFWMFAPQCLHREGEGLSRSVGTFWAAAAAALPPGAAGMSFLAAALVHNITVLLNTSLLKGRNLLFSHDRSPKRFLGSTFSFLAVPYI